MAKSVKKAEMAATDAGKFPIESCRERLARKWGQDAVALSGPCEGECLADCVCRTMSDRWDGIKSRFAGKNVAVKAQKLAMMVAASFMQKDDTGDCIKDLESIGFNKSAASGIADYMKAYAIDHSMEMELGGMADAVAADDDGMDSMPGDMDGMDDGMPASDGDFDGDVVEDGMDDMDGDVDMMDDGMGDMDVVEEVPGEMGSEGPADGMDGMMGDEGGMVTIEIPSEIVDDLLTAIEGHPHEGGHDVEEGGMPGEMGGMPGEGMDIVEEVPGEPAGMQEPGGQVVTNEGEDAAAGMMPEMGGMNSGGMAAPAAGAGGTTISGPGKVIVLTPGMGGMPGMEMEKAPAGEGEAMMESKSEPKEESHSEEGGEKKEDKKDSGGDNPFAKKDGGDDEDKGDDKSSPFPKKHGEEDKDEDKDTREASMKMRAGHLRRIGQNILKLGPEMSINNTDQLLHMEGKELGNAKDKGVEDPKPLSEGNVETEGYSAGDKKYQDGSTLGHEKKFEAHEVQKSEWTGGSSSLMGKDESFPEGKADVPAGSKPIGGEMWEGGDVRTKGTVIAEFKPHGVELKAEGKKPCLAKINIGTKISEAMVKAVGEIEYDGDLKAFAKKTIVALRKLAEESGKVDGVTKINTSELEASKFTNDGEKKPADGGAVVGSGKAPADGEKDITKINTGELEATKFTNDADKKPEDEGKKASTNKAVKTAEPVDAGPKDYNKPVKHSGDKDVEAPKPVEDNTKPEGYSAGGTKVQDGSTLGHEKKFEAHEVGKSEYSGGESSLMGKDESIPKDKPEVPVGGGKMSGDIFDGDNVSTKGTTIAGNDQLQKREAELRSEAKVREERLRAASVYVADALRHGEISEAEYAQELEKVAEMSVPAIQNLARTTRETRARLAARQVAAAKKAEASSAGLTLPIVLAGSNNDDDLVNKLVKNFKLTKRFDDYEKMK